MMLQPLTRPPHPTQQRQAGGVSILFALVLVLLLGFTGLVLDFGRLYILKSEAQNAVDACALAAATQLKPGQNNPEALDKAVSFGLLFSQQGEGLKNKVNLQNEVAALQPQNIGFADNLGENFLPASQSNPNTARFVQCALNMEDLPIYLLKILVSGLDKKSLSVSAVATLGQSSSSCATPLAVCKAAGSNASTNFGLSTGQWLAPPLETGSPYGTGNFGWVDFTPPQGGTSELAELLSGSGQCSFNLGQPVGESGKKASLNEAWNSRFGLYKSGAGNYNANTAPPDTTGLSYTTATWPLAANAYQGFVAGSSNYLFANKNHMAYQSAPPNPYSASTSQVHQSQGRIRRLAIAPIVDCGVWNNGNAMPVIEGWACVLFLHPVFDNNTPHTVEFLGLSSATNSPCVGNGLPGTYGPLVPQLVS